jgi:hypothetical protein
VPQIFVDVEVRPGPKGPTGWLVVEIAGQELVVELRLSQLQAIALDAARAVKRIAEVRQEEQLS